MCSLYHYAWGFQTADCSVICDPFNLWLLSPTWPQIIKTYKKLLVSFFCMTLFSFTIFCCWKLLHHFGPKWRNANRLYQCINVTWLTCCWSGCKKPPGLPPGLSLPVEDTETGWIDIKYKDAQRGDGVLPCSVTPGRASGRSAASPPSPCTHWRSDPGWGPRDPPSLCPQPGEENAQTRF